MWGYTPDWDAYPEWIAHLAADNLSSWVSFFAQFMYKVFSTLNQTLIGGVSLFEVLVAFVLLEVIYHVVFIHT